MLYSRSLEYSAVAPRGSRPGRIFPCTASNDVIAYVSKCLARQSGAATTSSSKIKIVRPRTSLKPRLRAKALPFLFSVKQRTANWGFVLSQLSRNTGVPSVEPLSITSTSELAKINFSLATKLHKSRSKLARRLKVGSRILTLGCCCTERPGSSQIFYFLAMATVPWCTVDCIIRHTVSHFFKKSEIHWTTEPCIASVNSG